MLGEISKNKEWICRVRPSNTFLNSCLNNKKNFDGTIAPFYMVQPSNEKPPPHGPSPDEVVGWHPIRWWLPFDATVHWSCSPKYHELNLWITSIHEFHFTIYVNLVRKHGWQRDFPPVPHSIEIFRRWDRNWYLHFPFLYLLIFNF